MADDILLDYISILLKSKGGADQLGQAATFLNDAAAVAHLLDAKRTDNADALSELCNKVKSLAENKGIAQKTAGLRALTVFAEQGSRSAFLGNFGEWAGEGLAALKSWESQPAEVLTAAWNLLTAIFRRATRLLQIPGVRRDAAPLAGKIAAAISQPADKGVAPSSGAFNALHAALLAVPSSFKQHVKTLEPIMAAGMLSLNTAAITCYAALPRASGDSEAWSSTAQKLLVTAHSLLDQIYLGLEPVGLVDSCRQGLDPGASPLTGFLASSSNTSAVESYISTIAQVQSVIRCLEVQLTAAYPVPVPLPSSAVLLLTNRLLSVDFDSIVGRSSASTGKLAELCLRLPRLHARACALLRALLSSGGVQLAPLMLSMARLMRDQLGKIAVDPAETQIPPSFVTRTAVYKATAAVLRAGGGAAAKVLAPSVIDCASVELYGVGSDVANGGGGAGLGRSRIAETKQQSRKKAKHAKQRGDDIVGAESADNAGSVSETASLSSQAAFLGVLEALIESGAALLTPAQRVRIDDICAHAARIAADAALQVTHTAEGESGAFVGLQLSSLKSLLACVLAPASHRPPHMSVALSLFKQGLLHQSSKIAEFSSHALLCCEALLHPRSLPHPAPLRPLRAEETAATGGALGIPAFWSLIDADLWIKTQQAQRGGGAEGSAEDMDIEPTPTERKGKKGSSKVSGGKRKEKEEAGGGFLAPLQQDGDEEGGDGEPKAAAVAAEYAEVEAILKESVAKKVKSGVVKEAKEQKQPSSTSLKAQPAVPAAAVGPSKAAAPAPRPAPAPRVTAPAVGDDSDSDESLPEIDSGESSEDDE